MDEWVPIADLPVAEQNKIRWLVRHAAENGIVEAGAAVKYGREWRINRVRLPEFLREHTLRTLGCSNRRRARRNSGAS